MANRTFNDAQSLEKEIKALFIKISIGASGAPTLVVPGSLGAASISRTSAGLYRLTLTDAFPYLMGFEGKLLASAAEDIHFQLKAETVATTKLIDFYTLTGATATDPASGDILYLKIDLKNTSVKI